MQHQQTPAVGAAAPLQCTADRSQVTEARRNRVDLHLLPAAAVRRAAGGVRLTPGTGRTLALQHQVGPNQAQ